MFNSKSRWILAAVFVVAFCGFVFGERGPLWSIADVEFYQPYLEVSGQTQNVVAAPSRSSAQIRYRQPCINPRGREESELCAQWRATSASEESALWAKWSCWVGFAGLIGLLFSLHYTRAAVRAATDATEDAEAALAAAKQTAEATGDLVKVAQSGQRAWITWETLVTECKNSSSGLFVDSLPKFSSGWKNTGATPALDVRCFNAFKTILPDEAIPTFNKDEISGPPPQSYGSNARISGYRTELSQRELEDFVNRRVSVLYYSLVEYSDIYEPNKKRSSEVCLHLIWRGDKFGSNGKPASPFDQKTVGPQNGLDRHQ